MEKTAKGRLRGLNDGGALAAMVAIRRISFVDDYTYFEMDVGC